MAIEPTQKFWLASFPRSGNTFCRNLFYSVFGLKSGAYNYVGEDSDIFDRFPVVKTHLRPHELADVKGDYPVVYLVRDGRDALVSMAHHRQDIVEPGSEFLDNLEDAIYAPEDSHFGGWSKHSKEWASKADIIVRFEDLTANPERELERIRKAFNLPKPDYSQIPTFEELRSGKWKYGPNRKKMDATQREALTPKFFRSGKSGGWKKEMPQELHELFWNVHGSSMNKYGYSVDGQIDSNPNDFNSAILSKIGVEVSKPERPFKVLLNANKALDDHIDGCTRYITELIRQYQHSDLKRGGKWEIDVKLGFNIVPIEEVDLENISQYLDTSKAVKAKKFISFRKRLGRINGNDYDLIHLPVPHAYRHYLGHKGNYVITVHDTSHLEFPEYFTDDNIKRTNAGLKFAKEYNAHIITVSEYTKQCVEKQYKINNSELSVVYNGVNEGQFHLIHKNVTRQVIDGLKIQDQPFILSIAANDPRKNAENTIRAFLRLRDESEFQHVNLVLIGRSLPGDDWQKEKAEGIIYLNYVSQIELLGLFNAASIFSNISYDEGFGLPIIEAMRCGTPVIAGNNSAQKEIVKDSGILVSPTNTDEIVSAYKQVLANKEVQADFRKKSLARASEFSWYNTGLQTLQVYEKVIAARK